MTSLRRVAAFVAFIIAAASQAQAASPPAPPLLAPLDVNKAQNWGEALAACDITRFLLSEPDVSASTIIAPGDGALRTLYPPLFMPPNLFYAPSLLQAFQTLEGRGEVDRKSVADARFRLANAVVPRFRKGDTVEKAFLADQMKLCNVLTDGVEGQKPKK